MNTHGKHEQNVVASSDEGLKQTLDTILWDFDQLQGDIKVLIRLLSLSSCFFTLPPNDEMSWNQNESNFFLYQILIRGPNQYGWHEMPTNHQRIRLHS